MKKAVLGLAAAIVVAVPAGAQEVPSSVDEVARPGGDLAGKPEIQLVKVADGFDDPIEVTSAGDGSGRTMVTSMSTTPRARSMATG